MLRFVARASAGLTECSAYGPVFSAIVAVEPVTGGGEIEIAIEHLAI
jgi:hypothetical protein